MIYLKKMYINRAMREAEYEWEAGRKYNSPDSVKIRELEW